MVSIKIARAGGGNSMMMGRRTVWIRQVTGMEVYSWWKGDEEDLSHGMFVATYSSSDRNSMTICLHRFTVTHVFARSRRPHMVDRSID